MEAVASKSTPADTRQKLLDAAARVFARCGLEGATTREIAREAGVNEVTLFRHFQSKDNLLAAVLHRTFDDQEARTGPVEKPAAAANLHDLRDGLRLYVQKYESLLRANILLLRTLIGEIHRYSEHELRVFKGIFAPLKVDLIAALHAARERGVIRADVDPLIATDLLWSMVFMQVLRCTSPKMATSYSTEQYFDGALDLFVRGVAPEQVGNSRTGGSSPGSQAVGGAQPEGVSGYAESDTHGRKPASTPEHGARRSPTTL